MYAFQISTGRGGVDIASCGFPLAANCWAAKGCGNFTHPLDWSAPLVFVPG